MAIHKLTDTKIRSLTSGKHDDGNGLRLYVSSPTAKRWVFRYTRHGKRPEIGLGSYPEVSLAHARDLAHKYRQKLSQGLDPKAVRIQLETNKISIPSFQDYAEQYIETYRSTWVQKSESQWRNTIDQYVNPKIGQVPVDEVSVEQILSVLKPIWTRIPETAKRLQGRIERILDAAISEQHRTTSNPARWKGHLAHLLPLRDTKRLIRHHPALPYLELPEFMRELKIGQAPSYLALQMLILTATRTSDVLNARWGEVDMTKRLWTVPKERTKTKLRDHRVPISTNLAIVLEIAAEFRCSEFLFPGHRHGRPLSNMTLLKIMRSMGYGCTEDCSRGDAVPHGFRSTFRDWAGETTSYPSDVIEMALAHEIKNKVEAAYRRGDLLDKRRDLMEDWANFAYGFEGKSNG
ncbi:integrase arm-type DNA-binding domain-containing protein [Litorivicinus sp.]|nr:integrase arm-type DNA-binding domain-containing protein [Litorivicinus sp.]